MIELPVLPHIGIGTLKLAMTPEQILFAIKELLKSYRVPAEQELLIAEENENDVLTLRYLGNSFFFMVTYKKNQAVEIAVDNSICEYTKVTLFDKDIFSLDAEDIVTALKSLSSCTCDLDDEQLSTNYEFAEIGVRLWREQPFHRKLLSDKSYIKEMSLVIDEMYQYLKFQLIAVKD